MARLNMRLHWICTGIVLLLDLAIVCATIIVNKVAHVDAPAKGAINISAPIGWLGVLGAVFIFGCYGILIKTPSVEEARCDCMVFQCYYSAAVAVVSMVIWLVAASSDGLTFTGSSFCMGLFFSVLWIISQVFGYNAIQSIGYAVGPAIWGGVTICTSFVWGVAAFDNPVHEVTGACFAIALMILGVCLAAASSVVSDRKKAQLTTLITPSEGQARDMEGQAQEVQGNSSGGNAIFGVLCALALGLCNGSLMVSLTCFQNGCPSIGVQAYTGSSLAALAFLPSLAAGILVAQPVLFFMYWGRAMLRGNMPQFHFAKVGVFGLLTGAFWGMGNFCAMFATVYLGQTIGFPLTQCCIITSGLWGIVYFREIQGIHAVGTFAAATVCLLVGAALDGMSS